MNKPTPRTVLASHEALRRAQEHDRLRTEARQLAFRQVLGSPQGRHVLSYVLFELCKADGGTFNGNGPQTFFNEGRRSVGIELELAAKACDRKLHRALVLEHLEREADDERNRDLAQQANAIEQGQNS